MTMRTYVDIHVLQTVPPSNLNRDDAGTPKQAIYGGVRRARVSSQAWKRATRKAFEEQNLLPPEQLGVRTKRLAEQISKRIVERTGLDEDGARRVASALLFDGLKLSKDTKHPGESAYLLFYGRAQLDRIVDRVADNARELASLADEALKKAVTSIDVRGALTRGHSVDVALFGRMVADLTALNVDAATQVAHAISTHPVDVEFDYYTAVDDAKNRVEEDAGAGMIGTVEFTSATLYRFATVGMHQLLENLDGDAATALSALSAFISGFALSMPTGHQNSFGNRTLPSLVSVVVRDDQPVNLVTAFEDPVRVTSYSKRGIAAESALRLDAELTKATRAWGLAPIAVASLYDTETVREPAALGPSLTFDAVLAATRAAVEARLTSAADGSRS